MLFTASYVAMLLTFVDDKIDCTIFQTGSFFQSLIDRQYDRAILLSSKRSTNMLIIYILFAFLVLVSESEPYWNNQGNTVTRYVPWFLVNCEFVEN